jgi:hypothetical protein
MHKHKKTKLHTCIDFSAFSSDGNAASTCINSEFRLVVVYHCRVDDETGRVEISTPSLPSLI